MLLATVLQTTSPFSRLALAATDCRLPPARSLETQCLVKLSPWKAALRDCRGGGRRPIYWRDNPGQFEKRERERDQLSAVDQNFPLAFGADKRAFSVRRVYDTATEQPQHQRFARFCRMCSWKLLLQIIVCSGRGQLQYQPTHYISGNSEKTCV